MQTREQIQELLQPLIDPESGKSLIDLQLIRDIMVKEDRISLSIVCLEEDDTSRMELEQKVRDLLTEGGVENIHIRLRNATDFERSTLRTGSSEDKPEPEQGTALKGHAAGLEDHELLDENSGVKFIAVASGKGGVGKSTVTVNLAVALARKGKKVGLIDADIYGFSIPDMMGIEEGPVVEEGTIIPVERFGVKVMSMGFFIRENSPVIWRGPMLGKMLRQFFSDVGWGELDYMLLDLPPGTGDVALDVHQMLPHSKEIIVTTPHATAAFVAARAGSMALQTEHEILGVIENMAYYECSSCGKRDYIFGRGGGARLAETLHTELLAQVPLGAPDNHISEPDFSPSVYKADTQVAQLFAEVADKLIAKYE
ncbi:MULTISPECIES: Mrp/NBP35 family ATP-binding protein [unclassified Paenibacillus]|uniref:Mrp/NBP35 family ATP-binding protein n=1 Tax=unclassified Paenibacillus TaxID=185978 RepID=UPI00240561E5|nr:MULTISPECIES: Mrp/NBP35 family ATP-binding protein [unclassified Paenibacillus]MDF9844482.1 ATP-binding protein involved in chromosome partitioning [Paenibacillus sp. PastF-2]MDF9851086.1 ATP-binding protein involved in chromosome partitioning [Paenibacillus sp. PastM-2]MDF9857585.1 ATP-binding protein involved in chromosome partitioning [Paenibacillus sp. PastF-1]MDH6482924.1 ATP-binding protein involved in chromosome partitioning [Paenibacillus sp. PastH-2]MDH6510349.1 ATP-binding protein